MTPVSVVVPAYNAGRFLGDTLASVVAQTLPPRELIVVDDASTDDTPDVVRRFAEAAAFPVKAIRLHQNSGGPARPMNVGANAVTGRWFTVLDHDDLLAPDAVAEYAAAAAVAPAGVGVLSSDFETFDASGPVCRSQFVRLGVLPPLLAARPRPAVFTPAESRALLGRTWCLPAKAAFGVSLWRSLGGFREGYRSAWDADFVWRAAGASGFLVIDRPLVRVRSHAASLSADGEVVSRELLRVYADMRRAGGRAERRSLSRRMRREWFDLAYGFYKERRYARAAAAGVMAAAHRLAGGRPKEGS